MSIEQREFLGFDKPAIYGVVDYLRKRVGENGGWDLSALVMVTPGARAGRRLLECLVSAAEPGVLTPPRIVTPSKLAELLYEADRPVASGLRSLVARMAVMRQVDRAMLEQVVPHPPEADDYAAWYALAEQLDGLAAELAGHRLTVAEVPALAAKRGVDLRNVERWQALAIMEQAYHQALAARGLVDVQRARMAAIEQGRCRFQGEIVLLGAADLSDLLIAMLGAVDAPVRALVHGEEKDAAGFTDLGCVVPAYWAEAQLDLGGAELRFVDSPRDQACAVVEAIARQSDLAADQITVGLADEKAGPGIERSLAFAGVPARGGGQRFATSRVALFLSALGRFAMNLDEPRFDDVAQLLRHPDVEAAVTKEAGNENRASVQRWLHLLDRYATDHLQGRLTRQWLGDADTKAQMKRLYERLQGLLPEGAGDRRALGEWSGAIAAACGQVFGDLSLDRQKGDDEKLIRSLQAVAEALTEQAVFDQTDDLPGMTFAQAVQLTLRRLAGVLMPEPVGNAAVELVGFLELPLDDGLQLIITSLNDQYLPASRNGDAWLPDHLRTALGMQNNVYRYGRDLLLFRAAMAGRKSVTLIASRRSAEGDPLAPSRLLLACADEVLIERINAFYRAEPTKVARILRPGERDGFIIPPPLLSEPVLTGLPVTAFRQYLACPYRFYLQYVLKLRMVDDAAVELDPPTFGNVVHDVLRRFGESEARAEARAGVIAEFLDEQLEAVTREKFGTRQRSAVRIQIEQVRQRLHAFASAQAKLADAGWRIVHAERTVEAAIKVDGEPFVLRGRMDRIDEHPDWGFRILDYKTADQGKMPRQTHRAARGSEHGWADLQLPLYLDLARELGIEGQIALGYFNLPKKSEQTQVAQADWSQEELADAAALRDVVIRDVRAQRFWPPGEPAVHVDAYSRVCQDLALNRQAIVAASSEPAEVRDG